MGDEDEGSESARERVSGVFPSKRLFLHSGCFNAFQSKLEEERGGGGMK
jgi:hypothetical protein